MATSASAPDRRHYRWGRSTHQGPHPGGISDYHRTVTNRLKTTRGHLEGILKMVENDAWCPDIMKQLAAVQGMFEDTSREVFRHHLETHAAEAIRDGKGDEIAHELMETLKYDKRVLRPLPAE